MAETRKDDSTQQLIAEAEPLGRPSRSHRRPDTREMVAQAERLIGRAPPAQARGLTPWWIAGLVLAAAIVGAILFLR